MQQEVAAPPWMRIDGAFVLVFAQDRTLLTVERKENGRIELPGGGVEPHHSPRETALKELYEETGLRLPHSHKLFLAGQFAQRVPERDSEGNILRNTDGTAKRLFEGTVCLWVCRQFVKRKLMENHFKPQATEVKAVRFIDPAGLLQIRGNVMLGHLRMIACYMRSYGHLIGKGGHWAEQTCIHGALKDPVQWGKHLI